MSILNTYSESIFKTVQDVQELYSLQLEKYKKKH